MIEKVKKKLKNPLILFLQEPIKNIFILQLEKNKQNPIDF